MFGRDSGVPLVDAVAASCAVPVVWPPVTIGDRRFMDGGVGSSANVDVVTDVDVVVMLAPTPEPGLSPFGRSLATNWPSIPAPGWGCSPTTRRSCVRPQSARPSLPCAIGGRRS